MCRQGGSEESSSTRDQTKEGFGGRGGTFATSSSRLEGLHTEAVGGEWVTGRTSPLLTTVRLGSAPPLRSRQTPGPQVQTWSSPALGSQRRRERSCPQHAPSKRSRPPRNPSLGRQPLTRGGTAPAPATGWWPCRLRHFSAAILTSDLRLAPERGQISVRDCFRKGGERPSVPAAPRNRREARGTR